MIASPSGRPRRIFAFIITGLCLANCSSNDADGDGADDDGPNGKANVEDMNLIDEGNDAADDDDADGQGAGTGNGCVGEVIEGESRPLAMYILFDQSGSMITKVDDGISRLDAVREATREFLNAPESAGISVGIRYFGHHELGETSCDSADYSDPNVDFGDLPDHATAIMTSLDAREPIGETPTGPAMDGACGYVQEWASQHPIFENAILLVTDGVPEAPASEITRECSPTLAGAVASTEACVDEGISTYVLGVGPSLDNLNSIAEAGDTKEAFLVEGDDVADRVLEALSKIRDLALPCDFTIPEAPEGTDVNFSEFNVLYTESFETSDIGFAERAADCDDELGGWYLDDPDDPKQILLCPASCELVSAGRGRFSFEFGCARRAIAKIK